MRHIMVGAWALAALWLPISAAGQDSPEIVLQNGHKERVWAVAFSPDGARLASASSDRKVKLWDVAAGRLLHTLEANASAALTFSPSGERLITVNSDVTVMVWDVTSGKLLSTFKGHPQDIRSAALSPGDTLLATAGFDGVIRLLEMASGKLLRTLEGHTHAVLPVVFSPDGGRLASASADRTLKIWDVASGQLLRTLEGHADVIWSVAFAPGGERLTSASADRTVKLWDLAASQLLHTLEGHTEQVNAVAFSPDGGRLASTSDDGMIRVWSAVSGQLLDTLEGHTDHVGPVAFAPDGEHLATGSSDRTVKVWDIASGMPRTLGGHTSAGRSLAFSPGGEELVTAHDDGMKVWDVVSGKLLRTLDGNGGNWPVAFSPDGEQLALADHRSITMWQAASGKLLRSLTTQTDSLMSVAFSPDGGRLAAAGWNGPVMVWEVISGQLLHVLEGHTDWVWSVAFSADGEQLASASSDGTVKVWQAATGQLRYTLDKGNSFVVRSVAFSPDGKQLVSAGYDRTVKVWEVASGRRIRTLEGHAGEVFSVAFSPDGQRLASAGADRMVKVWEAASGGLLHTLKGHVDDVWSVAFSPDGELLASVGTDTSVRYWRVATGEPVAISHAFLDQDYLTYTPQGFYAASEGGEAQAAWRIGGEVFGFEQYADELHRPELVARRLAGLHVEAPVVRLATDFPPTLRWLDPFRSTDQQNVELELSYRGASELDHLFLVFNGEPLDVSAPPATQTVLKIPLWLSARHNRLVAFATDRKRLKSLALAVEFEYLQGARIPLAGTEVPETGIEIRFAEPLPAELLGARTLRVNGREVEIASGDAARRTVRFLGSADVLQAGSNWIESQAGRFRFWWEEEKLQRLPAPYRHSFALIAAIDDYDREQASDLAPTGFEALEDMVARARELKQALVRVGFPEENISTLFDREATSGALRRQLERFWEGGDRDHADRVFVYFGGHGDGAEGRGHLITYDYDPQRPALTTFLMSDIVSRHFPHVAAHHLLVALDSCSSGLAIPGMRTLSGTEGKRLRDFRRLVVVQGDTHEKARNLLVAGTSNQQALYVNGGIFTRALIDGLRAAADLNRDGIIQFEELAFHIRGEVRAEAARSGVRQDPASLISDDFGTGRVLFFKP